MKLIEQERGSIAPLGVGLVIFTTALMLAVSNATSMFIFQKRLTTLAEAAAVFALTHHVPASSFMQQIGTSKFSGLKVSDSFLADGKTLQAVACALWQSPMLTIGSIGQIEICSHATARTGD